MAQRPKTGRIRLRRHIEQSARCMTMLDDVLADLSAEAARLQSWVESLDHEQWRASTPAKGWDIATTISHLAWTDEVAVLAATDETAWGRLVQRSLEDPEGFVDAAALEGAQAAGSEILRRWKTAREQLAPTLRGYRSGEKIPWFGPPMSPTSMATARFMETWAHGLDVADALGVEVVPTDRIRHVAHLGVRTRNFSFIAHGFGPPDGEFRVSLQAPSGEWWEWSSENASQTVSGSALDFCLLVTHRRHRDDLEVTATGDDAERWLEIAQAFAGPPGEGRSPLGDSR